MSLETAIGRVLQRGGEIPGVGAVLLTGSAARDELLPNSDYDFLILIDDGVPWPMPFRDGGREAYIDEERRQVEIGFSTFHRARTKTTESAAQGIPFRAQAFVEARVLARHGDAIDHLIAEARSTLGTGPPLLERQDVLWECYDIWNQMKDLQDVLDDPPTADLIAAPLFEHLLRFYFRIERRWLPRPKAMMRSLADANPEYLRLALSYVEAPSTLEQLAALQAMMGYLAQRFDLVFEAGYVSTR
jgi:predicted nucleotidyltransferase